MGFCLKQAQLSANGVEIMLTVWIDYSNPVGR